MMNSSDWAAEKNCSDRKLSAEDKRAILIFLGGSAGIVGGILLIGRYLHFLY